LTLVEAPREPRTEDRPGHRGRRSDTEQRPIDAAGEMPEHSGDSQAETDGNIRADRPEGIRADEAKQRADPQRAENQSDEAPEQADGRSCEQRCPNTHATLTGRRDRASRAQQVDAEDEQRDADGEKEGIARDASGHETSDERSRHGGRGHPAKEAPVDSSAPDVLDRSGKRRDRGDADIRSGPGRRARRGKHHHGKPDVAEHQADETAGERREEAPQRDRYQEEGVQALEYPR